MGSFGDYIVYVDESGDHALDNGNSSFPVFVLAFCIFPVADYVDKIVPTMQRLKFDHFGHDMVVLHEREIRKALGPFSILQNEAVRVSFLTRINELVRDGRFGVIACVIDKPRFAERRGPAENPYHVALRYGLERVFLQLQQRGQRGRETHVVFESRGSKEDAQLRAEYENIVTTTRLDGLGETLRFRCAPKSVNSSGLQLADMVARPIGVKVMRPDQENRAWDLIVAKMPRSKSGELRGYGLKVYPESERPPA
jgi:hypothetical protein